MKKLSLLCIPLLIILFGCPNPFNDDGDSEPVYRDLSILTAGSGSGSVSASPSAGSDGYENGTTVILTATSETGNTFLRWEGADSANGDKATVKMTGNKTVTAYFEPDDETLYELTLNTNPVGKATFSVPTGSKFLAGDSVDIELDPISGYSFNHWYTTNVTYNDSTDNPLTVIMDQDNTLTAEMNQTWTIIVHFAIDNNIDYDFEGDEEYDPKLMTNYLETLESIEAADTDDLLNIIVYMDGCQSYPGYTSQFDDGYYVLTGGAFADDMTLPISEVNSGSLTETKGMLNWAVSRYPGSRYLYSVFNHGGGFNDSNTGGTYTYDTSKGIGFDDSDDDALSHYELGQAVAYLKSLIGKNVDIFYPYACLMGGVELAYEVRDSADYILFSEEAFPADEWSYEALEEIRMNGMITPEELGTAFCDSAYSYFNGYREFTLALVDLSQIASLVSALDTFADDAIIDINSNANAADYNNASDAALSMMENYYVDIDSLMTEVQSQEGIAAGVKTDASAVQSALSSAITYFTSYGMSGASGMSVYNYQWYYGSYSTSIYNSILEFGQDTDWGDFQQLLIDGRTPVPEDSYETDHNSDFDATDAKSISVGTGPQDHTFHYGDIYDAVSISLSSGTNYNFVSAERGDKPAVVPSPNLGLYLFDSATFDNCVAYDFFSGGTPTLTFSCLSSGTYYLIIEELAGCETYYSLEVEEYVISADAYEPGDNSSGGATSITVDAAAQSHNLHLATDVDWLKFNTSEGGDYTIETSCGGNDILEMYVYNDSDLSNSIDYGWEGNNAHVTSADGGTYYVEVISYMNSVGDYSISVGSGYYAPGYDYHDHNSDFDWRNR